MTHASLFSGIGGCEVAAAMLGWDNLFHCEINPFGRSVLDYWFPNSESYEDITKTNFEKWRGRVDVLTGGFPCQPFSHAWQRRGADDDRYLWPQMLRVIEEIRPTLVIGENVVGLSTMVESCETIEVGSQASLFGASDDLHTYETRQRFTLERVCSDLEGIGYEVQPIALPACAVGAPHRRDRIFILAEDSMRVGLQGELAERRHIAQFGDSRTTSRDGEVRQHEIRHFKPNGGGGRFIITPTASDGMRANYTLDSLRSHNKPRAEASNMAEQLAHICSSVGGDSRLNPLFTEEMMGFPLMWTALPFLSTNGDKKHSKHMEMQ